MFLFVIIKVVLLYKSLLINSHRVITIEKKTNKQKKNSEQYFCVVAFVLSIFWKRIMILVAFKTESWDLDENVKR